MLQLINKTPFAAGMALLPDSEGIDTVFTVVKATFALGEAVRVADEQLPIVLADAHYGDPAMTSIRAASDICLGKPNTDVVLSGSAWAPGARPTWQMEVSVAVGSLAKTLRVSGDRVWSSGAGGTSMTWVAPFERMPLVWERAFGGTDQTDRGPAADPRNPVGQGFRAPRSSRSVHGQPLPNLEDPSTPISSPGDQPSPACFAPVAAHWEPRRSFAGTYDADWQKHRSPYLPRDFDPRFFQIAPAGLTANGYLRGGEPVEIRGATPSGILRFQLPSIRLQVTYRLDSSVHDREARLETVAVEPDASRLSLTWRASFSCDKRALRVREVVPAVVGAA